MDATHTPAAASMSSLRQKLKHKLLRPKYTSLRDDADTTQLCDTGAQRSGSADIVLDVLTPVGSRGSSRPPSAEPAAAAVAVDGINTGTPDHAAHQDTTTAPLLAPDAPAAAAADRFDQRAHRTPLALPRWRGAGSTRASASAASSTPSSAPIAGARAQDGFKGCFPFAANATPLLARRTAAGASPVPSSPPPPHPNDGMPTAFNNRSSILSRLSRGAKTPAVAAAAAATPAQSKAKPAPVKAAPHPLHAAAWRSNASALAERLAKPGVDANKRDRNSLTPLHYAAMQGSVDCVQLLLAHGANANKADAEGMLPLHFAALFNRVDAAALLLDHGSALNPPALKKFTLNIGWPTTPLICAAKMAHSEMVGLLMARGADVAGVTKASKSALHEAAWAGHAGSVAALLSGGADPNLPMVKTGHTALHLAAARGSQQVVQALVLGGAGVDARAKDGRTPLHLAADGGHMEAAATLVTLAGADVSAKDCAGFTPLHQAVDKNHVALAKALLDWGAPADATTKMGALPLNCAHSPDLYKLLRAVRWYGAPSCASGNNPASSGYTPAPAAAAAAAAAAGEAACPEVAAAPFSALGGGAAPNAVGVGPQARASLAAPASWLKGLSMQGKLKGTATAAGLGPLAATLALASGAALPAGAAPGADASAGGGRASPSAASEGSSVAARRAAREVTQAAFEAVIAQRAGGATGTELLEVAAGGTPASSGASSVRQGSPVCWAPGDALPRTAAADADQDPYKWAVPRAPAAASPAAAATFAAFAAAAAEEDDVRAAAALAAAAATAAAISSSPLSAGGASGGKGGARKRVGAAGTTVLKPWKA